MHINLLANKLAVLGAVVDTGETANAFNLSASTAAALLTLLNRGTLSVTVLGKIVGLSQPATTRLIDKLVVAGHAVRRAGPSQRDVRIKLTRGGERLAKNLQERRLKQPELLLSKLSDKDQRTLHKLLNAMLSDVAQDRDQARHLCRYCDHGTCTGTDCPIGSTIPTPEARS